MAKQILIMLSMFSYLKAQSSVVDNIMNDYNSAKSSIIDGNFIYDPVSAPNLQGHGLGTATLAPTIVNISNWTHSTIDFNNMWSGWGMPIPQQLSITREDGAIKGLLHKDNQQLYTIGKNYKSKLKDLEKIFAENQTDLCKFVSTFFELYRNKNLSKNHNIQFNLTKIT